MHHYATCTNLVVIVRQNFDGVINFDTSVETARERYPTCAKLDGVITLKRLWTLPQTDIRVLYAAVPRSSEAVTCSVMRYKTTRVLMLHLHN